MKAFINGIGSISAQKTSNSKEFLSEIIQAESNSLQAIEPDYKAFINPTLIRRMGRTIKMGVAAAQICLKDAELEMPDAIITGTGLGCIEDTEKFLSAISENKEQFLTPTSFIQSTHNTVGGQIALLLKCNSYNFTYVHRGFSFENCIIDAFMLLNEKKASNILIGGVDETTPNSLKLLDRMGHLKESALVKTPFSESKTTGSIAGEGANFFVLSAQKTENSYAQLLACKLLYKPKTGEQLKAEIDLLLQQNNLTEKSIDLVIIGLNGDASFDAPYHDLLNTNFEESSIAYYKHLSGEYHTANSFGCMLAAQIVKTQRIPASVLLRNKNKEVKTVLLYNHYRGINHTLLLLNAC